MHAASLERSERLQRVLWLLLDGQWHSTLEIVQRAQVCAVNSCIAELRANGIDIECRCVGVGRYEYRVAP
jgi:biotin operon repressor